MATPTDGKPISKFPNKHDAFLEITRGIRSAVEELRGAVETTKVSRPRSTKTKKVNVDRPRSSNLRVKKDFTDRHKDRFLADGFEYIANFFEGSSEELEKRNVGINADFRCIDANHFTASFYRHGKELSRCKIWLAGRHSFPPGIAYSTDVSSRDNSYNESLSVEDDGYTMFLKSMGMARQPFPDSKLTFEGAAEYLWGMFIERLQ